MPHMISKYLKWGWIEAKHLVRPICTRDLSNALISLDQAANEGTAQPPTGPTAVGTKRLILISPH